MEAGTAAPPAVRLSRAERRVKALSDALRTYLRDAYADKFGAVAPACNEFEVTIRLTARPGANWELEFNPALMQQISDQYEDVQAGKDVYQRGHVYCFRCSSSECEHARPGTPMGVFTGYDSTGRPEWHDLVQAFIGMKDPRVDQLFAKRPCALTLVQLGSQLRGEQLAAFGRSSKTYAVLGQVVAGYFPLPPSQGEGRIAVSLQIVESRDVRGNLKLHLNPVAGTPPGASLVQWLADGWEPSLHRALAVAGRELDLIELQACSARAASKADLARDALRNIPAVLRRLSQHLERGDRQGVRRTQHAEERREVHRPVANALEDARQAKAAETFFDEKARTYIVCGPKGRAHVFNPEGRHVTSFSLRPDGVEFRLRTQRWRTLPAAEFTTFRQALDKMLNSASTPPPEA